MTCFDHYDEMLASTISQLPPAPKPPEVRFWWITPLVWALLICLGVFVVSLHSAPAHAASEVTTAACDVSHSAALQLEKIRADVPDVVVTAYTGVNKDKLGAGLQGILPGFDPAVVDTIYVTMSKERDMAVLGFVKDGCVLGAFVMSPDGAKDLVNGSIGAGK